ncbi:hypothetical protein ACQ4PT_001755 [Festuca glaucescens]
MDDVQAMFVGRDQCLHRLDSAFVTLLPKREGATDLKDFRHISLVHSFAKLVTKLMALRLEPRMAELVDSNQSAFIRGRCIEDNFVLAHQSATLLHRKKHGFGPRWLRWLVALLCSASTQVLVNGSVGPDFFHGRGLRQGDPLAPLLFVLVMDVLATMFRVAERAGVLVDLAADGLKHRVSL